MKGKEDKVWKLEENKNLHRHVSSTRRINTMQKGYLLSKGKETEGMCKRFKSS